MTTSPLDRELVCNARSSKGTDCRRHNLARTCALQRNRDQSLKWLNHAIQLDKAYIRKAMTVPNFDNIRDDPRFHKLVYGEEEPS